MKKNSLQEANDQLLKKREIRKKERVNTLQSVKSCLLKGSFDEAADVAEGLRDSLEWAEVIIAFEASAAGQVCGECETSMDVFVNPHTLQVSVICFACREKKIKVGDEKAIAAIAEKVRVNIRRYMSMRGVPPLFLGASKDDFPGVWHPIIDGGNGLFISAPRGVGKTHLAAAIVREAMLNLSPQTLRDKSMESGLFPLFVSVPEVLLELRDSFGSDQTSERMIIDKYSEAPLLVLDDLGAEKSSDWSIQTLYTIIDRRYRNQLPTIFTSNYTLDQIAKQLDDRIASRIAGMCEVRSMTGEDRRIG